MTGSRGLLGTELKKHLDIIPFEGRIERIDKMQPCDLLIHAAAFTDVQAAEGCPTVVFDTNVTGTFNLVHHYKDTPIVYISTEYAKNPLGIYAWTKRWGEEIVKSHKRWLIIRTLFKPTPWELDVAYENQMTNGDYVDVIAKLIAEKIKSWDKVTSELCYVGTGRKTMLELARRTKPEVTPNKVTNPIIPLDY